MMFYVLQCRDCDAAGGPLPLPFETAEARGKWAAAHTRATGHDRWIVLDEERPEPPDRRPHPFNAGAEIPEAG